MLWDLEARIATITGSESSNGLIVTVQPFIMKARVCRYLRDSKSQDHSFTVDPSPDLSTVFLRPHNVLIHSQQLGTQQRHLPSRIQEHQRMKKKKKNSYATKG